MEFEEILNQARALKETSEAMIKAGNIGPVQVTTRNTAEALVQVVKNWRTDNPVISAINVRPDITWPEVLTIANAIYMLSP
jgi:hypothetical protein